MPELHDAANSEYAPPKPKTFHKVGCGMNEYNVQTLQHNPSTVSSISSTGGAATPMANGLACQDATSHLMDAFESISAFGSGSAEEPSNSANTTSSSSLQKLGKLRRISSESRVPARTSLLGSVMENSGNLNHSADALEHDEVTKIYSA
ncbi:unnamed protein product [Cylindrotheca closterium]|nr:unnamed protein product [Cylindrotheca closterium]